MAVTLRGLAQDLQNGAIPPCLPAYHDKAVEWTVAGEVATYVLYAVVRMLTVVLRSHYIPCHISESLALLRRPLGPH